MRSLAVILVCILLLACSDDTAPVAPVTGPTTPDVPTSEAPGEGHDWRISAVLEVELDPATMWYYKTDHKV